MRIVIATTSGFHLRHLAREFIALGEDVQFVSYLPRFRLRRDGLSRQHARSLFNRLLPGSAAALCRHTPSLQRRAVLQMLERTDQALAADLPRCDVFIGLSGMAVCSAEAVRQRFGARVIVERGSRHVLSQDAILRAGGGPGLDADYVARELMSYQVADRIALPSGHAVASFRERGFGTAKLFANPYGVALERFRPSPAPGGGPKLLFVGSWTRRKGADVLGAALAQLPEATLTHVGTPGDVPFPALPNFRSFGHRDHAALSQLMAEHHLLVLPSREDGFGMVLLEALAAGLPVVAGTLTGGPDIAARIARREAVELVEPGDVADLVRGITAAVERLPQAGSLREIFTVDEREYWSWRGYATRYRDFLRGLP